MFINMFWMLWSWVRLSWIRQVSNAYIELGLRPSFNARSHTGSDGRVLKLEPLTTLHIFNKNIKLGEWYDFDKIGDGYDKDSQYSKGFSTGWFNGYPFQFKLLRRYGIGYLDGFFLRKTFNR